MALGAGLLAGVGLAAPLGAIGILLVREGMAWGFREASPAAAAVATMDAIYCILAVALGLAVAPIVASWGDWPGLIGGLVLVLLGGVGVFKANNARSFSEDESTVQPRGRAGRFMLFAGLTAINPATLLYFVALLTGFGRSLGSFTGTAAFVAGVALASLMWQLGLVFVGQLFRGRITVAAQHRLSTAGFSLVIVLGLAALASSLSY